MIPLYSLFFQFGLTSPASTSFCMSGSSESSTTSAGRPSMTAWACDSDAPYDWSNVTPVPVRAAW